MRADMDGRVAVVTAAASGIGRATVDALRAAGAGVLGVDLDPSPLEGVVPFQVDATRPEAGEEIAAAAVAELGAVDALVNAVGGLDLRPEGFLSISDEEWHRSFELNYFSAVRTCRAVIPYMIEAGGGTIVSIASEQGRQPDPKMMHYAAAKAALINFSKAISIEFGPQGVRSNVVSPGPTRTPALVGGLSAMAEAMGITPEEAIRGFVEDDRRMPSGRLGEPEEVARVILFLASDLSSQTTGSDYRVDGGIAVTA
jgi:NAD(P)-dependent dehydrogenase (short-subunit alcohol dehydrogenase family)